MRLIGAMLVRNEADRHMRCVLDDLSRYCDGIVVLDDASIDETPEICASYDRVFLHRNPTSTFLENESALRFQLWHLALAAEPDWIMVVDADEMLEERFKMEKDALFSQDEYDVITFLRHDFWNATHYRVDDVFAPSHKKMLVRHQPGFPYTWDGFPAQSDRIPNNLPGPILWSDLRLKHFGYASPEDRLRKYLRAVASLPDHDHSRILSESPVLVEWIE